MSQKILSVAVLMLGSVVVAGEPRPWLSNYQEARKLARLSDRPLFVVFRCDH
jgi:hypothetical protein